jgi:GH24 family phage-related lysozyme (muramidase)
MQVSEKGINFIKEFEGCDLTSYRNAGEEHLTIGYGHYGSDVRNGQTITQQEADTLLRNDLNNNYVPYIEKYKAEGLIIFELDQNKIDALTSFAYNNGVGDGGLKTLVSGRDIQTVADKMLEYYHSGSPIHDEGLKRRRRAERELFLTGGNPIQENQKVRELQTICCEYGYSIDVDGKWGPQTEAAVRNLPLAGLPYRTPQLTKWIQLRLGCDVDGIYGQDTYNAVIEWQKGHKLKVDGIAGYNTIKSLALA